MKAIAGYRKSGPSEIATSINMFFVWVTILVALFAGAAHAQTVVNQPTNTTLWAGSQDITQFGPASLTLPTSGVILSGTAISAITGQPVRHLWVGDQINGVCRIDPEVDQVIPATGGIGGHVLNDLTCVSTIMQFPISAGQLAFDASTNTLYVPNNSRLSAGILRLHYIPSGDGGQGSFDLTKIESLIGTQLNSTAFGPCPAVKDSKNGTLVPALPNSAALGPDGNLYTGSLRDGAIIRIISPATFNPATDCPGNGGSGVTPGPNDKIQIPILSPDEATSSGHNFGLGWIGHALFGGDSLAPWVKFNADQCFTAANGNNLCGNPVSGGAPLPAEILASLAGAPQGAMVTDAQYPTSLGATAYFASFPSVTKVTNIVDATTMSVQTNYGGTFNFITGLTADASNNQVLYVGADPDQGGVNGAGQIWLVNAQPCPPGFSLAPINVTATASASSQATVNWTEPVSNCQTVTSYVVRTLLAGGTASGVPDFTVTPTPPSSVVPTTAIITGLTNGTSYQFEVEACDLAGCSAFSALSNVAALLPPATPTGVTASIASPTSANVAWSSPLDAQGGYLVSAYDSLAPTVVAATAGTPCDFCARFNCGVHATTIGGLISGHTYTFTVHAENAFGNSPESAPSLPLTLPVSTDISVLMNEPATVSPGATLSYVMTITNNGPLNAFQVTLSDTLPAAFSAVASSQGVCAPSGGVLSCNLGAFNAGSSATVTLSVTVPPGGTGSITNTATVTAFDSTGATIADPNTNNNTAIATVFIITPCGTSTTDIQTTGSAQNGNPVHGAPDTFTWQIKNNQGSVAANCVTFTASTTAPTGATMAISSVSTTIGACSINANAVRCTIGTIPGGQTAIVSVTAIPSTAEAANSYSMTGAAQLGPGSTDTNSANNSFTVLIGAQ